MQKGEGKVFSCAIVFNKIKPCWGEGSSEVKKKLAKTKC